MAPPSRRWSIRGFSTGRQNYYANDIPLDRFTDPERRLEGETLRDRKGKLLAPEKVAVARIDTLTQEPDRVFIRYVDAKTGRAQHVWIYLEDFDKTSWAQVDWRLVEQHLEKQYNVTLEPEEEEPIQAPAPPPPAPPKQAPPKAKPPPAPPKKRTVWDKVGEGIRKIFNPEWPSIQPPAEPKPKAKRSVWGGLPDSIRRIFGRK